MQKPMTSGSRTLLAPAQPPDSGEPRSAAPLDSAITVLPAASGVEYQNGAQLVKRGPVTGDPDHLRASLAQDRSDAPAEASAGPGDQRRRPG